MKQTLSIKDVQRDVVAPHAGAWIETGKELPVSRYRQVAPHAGAWIETSKYKKGG